MTHYNKEREEHAQQWPCETRIDIIGQNGNEGLHYGQTEQTTDGHTDVETAEKAKDGLLSG